MVADNESPAYYEGALKAYEREVAALDAAFHSLGDGRVWQFQALLRDYGFARAESDRQERALSALGLALARSDARSAERRALCIRARTALTTLPQDCLGTGHDGEREWPLRGELIDALTKGIDNAEPK